MVKKPSSWVNFQDYLGVNQDQGRAMADQVASNVTKTVGAAKTQLSGAKSKLKNGAMMGSADSTLGDPNTSGGAKARAQGAQYGGPESLDAADPTLAGNVGDAVARLQKAGTGTGRSDILREGYGQGMGGAGTGGSALDSALLSGVDSGAAMRGLESDYGTLGQDYGAGKVEGDAQVRDAKITAQGNVDKWSALEGKLLGQEKAVADKKQKAIDDEDFDQRWHAALEANVGDRMNNNFDSFNQVFNPISQIAGQTGNRDPVHDWGKGLLNPMVNPTAGKASGSTKGSKIWWQTGHKEVFRQMDDAQWAELNALPPATQNRWLDQRASELNSGKPRAGFDKTKDYGKNAFYGWKI